MQSTTRIFHNVRDPDRPVDTGDPSFVERMNPTRYLYYKEITRNLEGYEKDCQRFSEEIQRITTEMKGAREEADLVAHWQKMDLAPKNFDASRPRQERRCSPCAPIQASCGPAADPAV